MPGESAEATPSTAASLRQWRGGPHVGGGQGGPLAGGPQLAREKWHGRWLRAPCVRWRGCSRLHQRALTSGRSRVGGAAGLGSRLAACSCCAQRQPASSRGLGCMSQAADALPPLLPVRALRQPWGGLDLWLVTACPAGSVRWQGAWPQLDPRRSAAPVPPPGQPHLRGRRDRCPGLCRLQRLRRGWGKLRPAAGKH